MTTTEETSKEPKDPKVVREALVKHKPTKPERKLRAALDYVFGPHLVAPSFDHSGCMQVYVRTENLRVAATVEYRPTKKDLKFQFGTQVWTAGVEEITRTAMVHALHPFYRRMQTKAQTYEETRAEEIRAEAARVRKEKREAKLQREAEQQALEREERAARRLQRILDKGRARAARYRRPWYEGGQCSKAQTRFRGLDRCVRLRGCEPCSMILDLSDFCAAPPRPTIRYSQLEPAGVVRCPRI